MRDDQEDQQSNRNHRRPSAEDAIESKGSITTLIDNLKAGESQAAAALWDRYFERLVRFASSRLRGMPTRASDEEDVVLLAMDCLFRKVEAGELEPLEDRNDLWKLLLFITNRKVIDLVRSEGRQKRGGQDVRGESVFANSSGSSPIDLSEFQNMAFLDAEPSPEFLVDLKDQLQHLLDSLPDERFRKIAMLKMRGESDQAVAKQVGVSVATVERKLRRIRDQWRRHGDAVGQ